MTSGRCNKKPANLAGYAICSIHPKRPDTGCTSTPPKLILDTSIIARQKMVMHHHFCQRKNVVCTPPCILQAKQHIDGISNVQNSSQRLNEGVFHPCHQPNVFSSSSTTVSESTKCQTPHTMTTKHGQMASPCFERSTIWKMKAIAGWQDTIANSTINLLTRRIRKCLTFSWAGAIIIEHTTRNSCSCGGIGRRTGLKIRRINLRAGSSPATSTTTWVQRTASISYRGVEQLVACRAHNPKVAGSNPASATTSSSDPEGK